MSLIWVSCAAYDSSGFATTGGVGVADGVTLGDGAGALEDPTPEFTGMVAHGFGFAPPPAPPAPPSNVEKSSPPAARAPGFTVKFLL